MKILQSTTLLAGSWGQKYAIFQAAKPVASKAKHLSKFRKMNSSLRDGGLYCPPIFIFVTVHTSASSRPGWKRVKSNAAVKPLGDSNQGVIPDALEAAKSLLLLHQPKFQAAVPEEPPSHAVINAADWQTQFQIEVPTAVYKDWKFKLCSKLNCSGCTTVSSPQTPARPKFTSTPIAAAPTLNANESCDASQQTGTPARKKTMASNNIMLSRSPGLECDKNESVNELSCSTTIPTSVSRGGSTLTLDEKTGTWMEVEAEPSDTSAVIDSEKEPDQQQEMLELVARTTTQLQAALILVEEQRKQLEALNNEAEQSPYKKKWEAARRGKNRAEQKLKLKINLKSPYFSDEMLACLFRKTNRGIEWKIPEIRQGLIYKMKWGSKGYSDFVQEYPIWPSLRTLQECVQFIKFHGNGIQEDMFDLLEVMVRGMSDIEKDCTIVLDEMDMQQGRVVDPSTGQVLGECTLPGHAELAKKALVFVLAGVSKRWKVAVAVFFTNKKSEEAKKEINKTGEEYKKIINEIVLKSENIGLKPCAILSDMGSDNLAMWLASGIEGTRGFVNSKIDSPTRKGEQIVVMPDPIHLFKNIKGQLESSRVFTLPDDIVKEYELPSNVVKYEHIENLYNYEKGKELKVAFRLKEWNVYCKGHFSKMNMGSSRAVFSHTTATGLKRQAKVHKDDSYYTTAWFVEKMNIFFDLVTCRSKGLAISKRKPGALDKVLKLFELMERIFSRMDIAGEWKPCQRGMRVLIDAYFHLIPYFLETRGYLYLMLGRLTSDCIENIFSLIRFRQPVPHAQGVLHCLKIITLAQFSKAIKGSKYDYEDCEPVSDEVDFLEEARKRFHQRAQDELLLSAEELLHHPIKQLCTTDFSTIDDEEKCVLYDMAGSTMAGVISSRSKFCATCIKSARWTEDTPHVCSSVTSMKEFTFFREKKDAPKLFYVSDDVFKAILSAEITFRMYRDRAMKLKHSHVLKYFVDGLMYVWNGSSLHDCHGLRKKILTYFIQGRLKEFTKRTREEVKYRNVKPTSESMGSKSVFMRAVVNKMKSGKRGVKGKGIPATAVKKTVVKESKKRATAAKDPKKRANVQKEPQKRATVQKEPQKRATVVKELEPTVDMNAMKVSLSAALNEELKEKDAPPKLNVTAMKALLHKKLG